MYPNLSDLFEFLEAQIEENQGLARKCGPFVLSLHIVRLPTTGDRKLQIDRRGVRKQYELLSEAPLGGIH